jgi:SAM-dependent methyltransferase
VAAGPDGRQTCAIMAHPSWNDSYAAGELPWHTGEPKPLFVEFVTSGRVQPARALEIGAGTGTNSLYLAERGFEVLGVDVAPLASEQANAKLNGRALPCRFAVLDFLAGAPEGCPFEFIFDRGCFHVLDEPEERAQLAAQVAAALAPGGLWLSLIGSTEGPPRRSAREVTLAIEPALEIVELRSAEFRAHDVKAWFCLARRRTDDGDSALSKSDSAFSHTDDDCLSPWRILRALEPFERTQPAGSLVMHRKTPFNATSAAPACELPLQHRGLRS